MQSLMDLGGGPGWIMTIVIGGLAGWIAEKVTKSDMGILMNVIFGVLGSIVGGLIANLLGLRLGEIFSGWFLGNLIVSVVGAIILVMAVKLLRGRKTA
jgi:uncharacterized membrane protein YeaQ/YmgE (transglycosylase-associated protein family)